MEQQRLLKWYFTYALLLGITSYRDGLQQTWLTRTYALAINVFELVTMPIVFWRTSRYIQAVNWFPQLITSTIYVLCAAAYAAIIYTIVFRDKCDAALFEIEREVARIRDKDGACRQRSLDYLFYMKFGTVLYLCVSGWLGCFMLYQEKRWLAYVVCFLFGHAMNIPVVASYRYFLALWRITCGYQYINEGLKSFMQREGRPTALELKQLQRLWTLHMLLSRCTQRLNRIYDWVLLAVRLNSLTSSVIIWYWGVLFYFGINTPFYMLAYGTCSFWIRLFDFYLSDVMCDRAIEYQSVAHHDVSEGYWYKELNAYLLYANSSKLSFWICGLYKANQKCWFRMIGSIVSYSIVLLQFHLLMKDKYAF